MCTRKEVKWMDREFNLLEEGWIPVSKNGEVREVSLKEALINAHQYDGLQSEMATLDAAVLRQMLAVLQTVFYRYDESGNFSPAKNADQIIDRFEAVWNEGKLPAWVIEKYLDSWKDKFWLFDEKEPFGQALSAEKGTEYKTSKLIGSISESNNKIRIFSPRSGEDKREISYPEAARWLIHINAYDDTSNKKKQKGLPSCGAGWVGQLGQIYVKGKNLFETLMLNLVLLDEKGELWGEPSPAWEKPARQYERTEIPVPDNLAALYTLASRRILLKKNENKKVAGFRLLGGDFFNKTNAFIEPHTLWKQRKETKKGAAPEFVPKRMDPSRQIWRDFASIAVPEGKHLPGIVSWIETLRDYDILDDNYQTSFTFCGPVYGDKDFMINDMAGDSLQMHLSLLGDDKLIWAKRIEEEIAKCDQLAGSAGYLFADIARAAGGDDEYIPKHAYEKGKERMYELINPEFTKWLAQVDPASGYEIDDYIKFWNRTAKDLAFQLSKEAGKDAPISAYLGRQIDNKGTKKLISLPKAQSWFHHTVNQIYGEVENEHS